MSASAVGATRDRRGRPTTHVGPTADRRRPQPPTAGRPTPGSAGDRRRARRRTGQPPYGPAAVRPAAATASRSTASRSGGPGPYGRRRGAAAPGRRRPGQVIGAAVLAFVQAVAGAASPRCTSGSSPRSPTSPAERPARRLRLRDRRRRWPPRARSLAVVQLVLGGPAGRRRHPGAQPRAPARPGYRCWRRARRPGRARPVLGGPAARPSLGDAAGQPAASRASLRGVHAVLRRRPAVSASAWCSAVPGAGAGSTERRDRPDRRARQTGGMSAAAVPPRSTPRSPPCCAATPPAWSPPSSSSTTPARCSCSPGWTTRRCAAR